MARKTILTLLFLQLFLPLALAEPPPAATPRAAASQPAVTPSPPPATAEEAVAKAKATLDKGKAGQLPAPQAIETADQALVAALAALQAAQGRQWWLLAGLAVSLLMFLIKLVLQKKGLWDKLGKWKYALVPIMSVLATLLAAFQGGVSWATALGVFTSSNTMATLQVLYDRVLMGRPKFQILENESGSDGA